MKKLLLLVLLCCGISAAAAPKAPAVEKPPTMKEYVLVQKTPQMDMYMAVDKMKYVGDTFTSWILLSAPPSVTAKAKSVATKIGINCNEETASVLAVYVYSGPKQTGKLLLVDTTGRTVDIVSAYGYAGYRQMCPK